MAIARPPDLEHGGGLLGPVMSRRRTTTLLLLAFNVVCIFIVVHLGGAAISTLRPPFAASSVQPETDDDPCAGFNPHADPTTDPVDCLRARQWRQIERFRALPNMTQLYKTDSDVMAAVDHVERCVLGLRVCPDRPLLITDWYYIQQMEHISTRGETVWTGPILDAARDFGYTVARFNKGQSGLYRAWRFASLLSESLHMYISGEENAVECLRNPRCVRPEDYTPSIDPAYWYDLSLIPEDQMGTVPVWRVMVITFWGSRPHGYDGMHISAKHHCGQGEGQDWAWHVLGRKFQIAPYAYPDHTHIPITIEKACLDAPKVPPAERENTIAILAKVSKYFNHMDGHWPEIVKRVKNFGADLWSFAHEVDHIPVPEGLIKIGTLPRDEYSRKSGSARALLGIGSPPISPTPYDSLCRGVPIVMPYKGDTPTPKGWALYKSELVQHGPINMIGKPYVYTYKLGDVDDMAAKLERAYNNLIESYVPPEMKAAFVVDRVHEVLNHDWEGEYRSLRLEMGGHVPQYDAGLVPTCIKSKMCAAFSDYVPDSFYLPGKPRPVKPTN